MKNLCECVCVYFEQMSQMSYLTALKKDTHDKSKTLKAAKGNVRVKYVKSYFIYDWEWTLAANKDVRRVNKVSSDQPLRLVLVCVPSHSRAFVCVCVGL